MRKYFVALLVPLALVTFWAFAHNTQQTVSPDSEELSAKKKNEQLIAAMVNDILENGHFSSKTMNDDVSEYAFKEYLKRLDYNKLYFLKEDIESLKTYKKQIDDEMKSQKLEFYFKATEIGKKRIEEVKNEFESLLAEPFNYDNKETIELDQEKREYFKTKAERTAYWKKYLKYLTVNRLANKIEKQEKDKLAAEKSGEAFEEKPRAELEESARNQVAKNMSTRFERLAEIDAEDQFAEFINSVSAAFGPHSTYFPPQEKENFDMRMTGRLEGIGAQLTKEGEYIKVVEIVPGSASWRQGDLKADDLIVKVAQGDEEPIDVVGASMKETIKMIRGPKGTEVRLTVQKSDGSTLVIPIIRDVVVQEETYAKSALIKNNESNKTYGYVYLPSFYFKARGQGRSCAEDVKNEVVALKEKGVSGIILDLRNNGGGSLDDAVTMAGHFIKKGPVVQVKSENESPRVLKDRDESIAYNGPMIIMINNFSASASEILGAALKDYKRAVIVGNTTLGKGTVQRFLDLNRMAGTSPHEGDLGAFKLTFQQFYRINGESTQLHGVSPDIFLPDLFGYMETGMRQYDNALPFDKINSVFYSNWDGEKYNMKKLQKMSHSRVKKSDVFSEVVKRNKRFKKERENTVVTMSVEEELAEREESKAANKAFKELYKSDDNISIVSLQQFKAEEEEDVKAEKKKLWEKQLKDDYYLNETIYILEDMLAMLN